MELTVEQYLDIWRSEGNKANSALINILIVSLISSDTILTKEDCLNSKRELLKLKDALAKLSDVRKDTAEHYMDMINRGIEICDMDYAKLFDG
jgi:inorganic pyrophosphatase/exopolyphosphatase